MGEIRSTRCEGVGITCFESSAASASATSDFMKFEIFNLLSSCHSTHNLF